MRSNDRTGEIKYNHYNSKMEIITYSNSNDIIVEFENGYKIKATYAQFKNQTIKSPYDESVYNIGYLGEGKYKNSIGDYHTKEYDTWKGMLMRCYDKKYQKKRSTYIGCSVCQEWLNFQNFAEWYHKNYYEIENEKMALDKDILHKGNKIYSPNNCIFVARIINNLFVKCDKARGDTPIGVSWNKASQKYASFYDVHINQKTKKIYLGTFNTAVQAFNTYKFQKEKHIKKVAEYYKDTIPKELYDAMYEYKVEITD